jgi:hypothetical protein
MQEGGNGFEENMVSTHVSFVLGLQPRCSPVLQFPAYAKLRSNFLLQTWRMHLEQPEIQSFYVFGDRSALRHTCVVEASPHQNGSVGSIQPAIACGWGGDRQGVYDSRLVKSMRV